MNQFFGEVFLRRLGKVGKIFGKMFIQRGQGVFQAFLHLGVDIVVFVFKLLPGLSDGDGDGPIQGGIGFIKNNAHFFGFEDAGAVPEYIVFDFFDLVEKVLLPYALVAVGPVGEVVLFDEVGIIPDAQQSRLSGF